MLQFDDYNYKMLNDDVRRVVHSLKQEVEKYNHEKQRLALIQEREKKLTDVYLIDAAKAAKKKAKELRYQSPNRKESRRNLELY